MHMTDRESTVVVDAYQRAATGAVGSNAYRGYRIHALPGLHEFTADLVQRFVPAGATVLDLAAGTGALSARLQDLHYHLHATDYVSENFRCETVAFTQCNLNEGFSHAFAEQRFQAIVASEIIEHLENPRHVLRQCHSLLEDGGHVLLTTPNINHSGSIASFLRTGTFLWFSNDDYRNHGHIMPLTPWQLQHCFDETGFELLWTGSFGDQATRLQGSPRLRLLATCMDWLAGTPRHLRGEIFACVAVKRPR
jgi:SAM-dependent methyltransferase